MSNQEIITVAFKHNGKVHRTWYQTYLIEQTDEYVAVGSTHSFVVEADGRKWHAIEPAVQIFMKKKWLNVVCMIKATGINYYVNIASPSVFEDNVVKYIDYDLDEVIKYNFNKVRNMIENKEFPFSHDLVDELYKKFLSKE